MILWNIHKLLLGAVGLILPIISLPSAIAQSKVDAPGVEPALGERRMQEIRSLINQGENDVSLPLSPHELEIYEKAKAQQEKDRIHAIQSMENIKPYLWKLIHQGYLRGDDDVRGALEALALRPDLDDRDVATVAAKMKEVLSSDTTESNRAGNTYFLEGAIAVMAARPSPKNEDLIIATICSRYGHNLILKLIGASALGKCGTEKSLPALKKSAEYVREWANGQGKEAQSDVKVVTDAIIAIQSRGAEKR